MPRSVAFSSVLLFLVALSSLARAEEKPSADKPADAPQAAPGHSTHGEAFDEGPRQQARLMGGTGRVHLEVSTDVPGAQALFDQGVGQLHGFWYFEAERSFRQVAALDPQCAMAYWGMAMANINNDKRAKKFIEKAVQFKPGVSPREALWIDGLSNFYNGAEKDDKNRRRGLIRNLERLVNEYPDELEAKAFLALQIWHNSSHGMQLNSHQAVNSILSEVFAKEPLHPAHHYRIHLWDHEKAERALESAALCGESAPQIAHMWHMPGHIYSNLKRYSDAAWQQEAATRVDHANMMRDRVLPDQIHNYAHNTEWLIRDLVHVGRAHDAVTLSKNLIEQPRHPSYNTLHRSNAAQYGRLRLFEVLQQFELWDDLVAACDGFYLEPTDMPAEQIKRLRALGVAYFSKGAALGGQLQITALTAMLDTIKANQQQAGDAAEKKAREEKKPDDQIAKAKADAIKNTAGETKRIESALADLNGRLALLGGAFDTAKAEFEKAGDLSKEFQSQAAATAGDFVRAEQLAREASEASKNEVLALANYADVLMRAGKTAEAKVEFQKLRELASRADLDMPIFRRLAPIARELGLSEDWRAPVTIAADFGKRPSLDSLGPLRWQPGPAESWTLPNSEGQPVSLSDYRGKPVIVVFYLGFGCIHCVEQLKTIQPMAGDFAQAGISLVAVSTEGPELLKTALANRGANEPALGLPIVVDPALSVFKQYRAYDDFEQAPLHATFLIDGAGLVRWQDIGPEPFMDLKFLLGESKRLLTLPPQ
jgi:peroxiredoxin/Flp pilus assembly protein TadD